MCKYFEGNIYFSIQCLYFGLFCHDDSSQGISLSSNAMIKFVLKLNAVVLGANAGLDSTLFLLCAAHPISKAVAKKKDSFNLHKIIYNNTKKTWFHGSID